MADKKNFYSSSGGFPKTNRSPYQMQEDHVLTPEDHFLYATTPVPHGDTDYYINDKNLHFTRDVNDISLTEIPTSYEYDQGNGNKIEVPVFSGSTTDVNPLNDPAKQAILDTSLETYQDTYYDGKLSPLQPFTRSNPQIAHEAIMFTYNRTKLPVADVEWRKGFRHIFFTRPECYVMCSDNAGGIRLCSQAENDTDFNSTYTRLPHVVQMLAPFYITGSFENGGKGGVGLLTNWHYLLSNQVDGFTTVGTQMSVNESITKGFKGYTINPAGFISSTSGGTFDVTFNETRNLECYESLRLWMKYCDKVHKGVFAPSYNGYQYDNNFYSAGNVVGANKILHPYDRAIDYAATMFDIITNESGTKILYWCKYGGIFPISAQPALSNNSNSPIVNVKTTAQFRYMYKIENSNRSLIEFNYNAGVVGKTGHLTPNAQNYLSTLVSQPFLMKQGEDEQYLGAAGMFTGSPYILMGPDTQANLLNGNTLTVPYLQFSSINNPSVNKEMNRNIINDNWYADLSPISL